MQVWLSQTAQQPITEASLILCRFLQSNLRPARCETPAAQTRRTGYITHDAVRFFRSRSCRCGARVRGSFMWILAELDGQGPSSSARPAARLSAVCAHIQYRSTCWLLQSVCTASNPPSSSSSLPSLPLSLTYFLPLPLSVFLLMKSCNMLPNSRTRTLFWAGFPSKPRIFFLTVFTAEKITSLWVRMLLQCQVLPVLPFRLRASSSWEFYLFSSMILRNCQSGFLLSEAYSFSSFSSSSSLCGLLQSTLKTYTKRIRMLTKTT